MPLKLINQSNGWPLSKQPSTLPKLGSTCQTKQDLINNIISVLHPSFLSSSQISTYHQAVGVYRKWGLWPWSGKQDERGFILSLSALFPSEKTSIQELQSLSRRLSPPELHLRLHTSANEFK